MKKLFVSLCVVMLSVISNAQGLGDYMEIDGVPGFVFHVDESGKHGLVMSFRQMSEKQAVKFVKKGLLSKEKAEKLCAKENKSKISKKERENIYKGVMESLGDDGEQNQVAIVNYCKEKDMPLSTFPMQEWAASLGDGWFIPGENELVKFAEFYIGGVGKEYKISGIGGFQKRSKELSNDTFVQTQLYMLGFKGLLSSSMKDSEQGFLGLIHYGQNGFKTAEWFEFEDKATVGKAAMGLAKIKQSAETLHLSIVAVHKF